MKAPLTLVMFISMGLILLCIFAMNIGNSTRSKIYSCGYMRGIRYMARINGTEIRPLPYDCSEFDDLETK